MKQLDAAFVRRVLDSAPEGIAICDGATPGNPLVYVNAAFEQLTGYAEADVLGANLGLLHANDQDQEGVRRLQEAFSRGTECRVLLRNYRKKGELFWNEIYLQPMHDDAGQLGHFVAFFRDAGSRLRHVDRGSEGLPTWLREDRITGLSSRAWFEELLSREWHIARRESLALTMVLFDIDALKSYSDTYGRSGADACVRRVARGIASGFRRGSDVVGVWGEGRIAVLAVHRDGTGATGIVTHATATVRKVADMYIHHPRSPWQKYVTVTAGLATVIPGRDEESPTRLIETAENALREAKVHMRGGLNHAPE